MSDWVEILRVHDPMEAQVTTRFLEDHGVPVRTSGGATTALPMISLTDVRVLVAREDVERAEQVLSAMRDGAATVHPFRDAPPEEYEAPTASHRPKMMLFVLAALIAAYVLAAAFVERL
jgi:hypothetical protein